jgi:hypothetical protein
MMPAFTSLGGVLGATIFYSGIGRALEVYGLVGWDWWVDAAFYHASSTALEEFNST